MYFELYKHYAKGHLLEPGALNDQPAWYVDAMSAVESELKQLESDLMKRSKSDASQQ